MSADPACRAPVPPEGAVPRTCVPFAHVPAVPVVAVPYVPVPVPSGLPVLSVAGILPDRTGNVDVTRFLEEWAAGTLADKADKAAPAAAGNLASLDESGNLLDSGATPASIARSAAEAVVANAPGTMDTLKEIADILGSAQQSGTVLKRISDLEEGKAPAQHVHDASHVTSGTFALARIPPLNASKITSGTFDADRIPPLAAKKIVSGTFDADRIPPLNASKITSGTLSAARLPFSVDETLATQGDAADAKAVGDALRGGFTPWEFSGLPAGVSVETVVYSEPTWSVFLSDGTAGSWELPQTALLLDGAEAQSPPGKEPPPSGFTATRHLITPTKTSQLTNDSGFITSSDLPYALVSKSPVSGAVSLSDRAVNLVSPTVTELPPVWEWSDGLDHGQPVYGVIADYGDYQDYGWGFSGEGGTLSHTDSLGNSYEFVYDGSDATELSFYDYISDETLVASLVTPYETDVSSLALPPAVTGKVRDFMVRLAMPENAAMFSWPSGVEYETEDGQMPDVSEPGVYLLAFTESSAGSSRFELFCRKVQGVE